ncbi:type II toxin-antitoxin system RelE/ParE family toxin [Coleofasciculus sp. H7-2]|uniref:type II toxin-antitoxin system RelE family toxin n=1 Tax=Coleofasciculus sp. H7-2 TaxID=3351545 RepID=UPI00366D1CC2
MFLKTRSHPSQKDESATTKLTPICSLFLCLLKALRVERILPKTEALATAPHLPGCKKLVGEDNFWRIRLGDYRVIYTINDDSQTTDILAVQHRSKADN